MELKCHIESVGNRSCTVLIVPSGIEIRLGQHSIIEFYRSNRTFMELKLSICDSILQQLLF